MDMDLKPSPLFTDGAVLCRDKEIRIFGEAAEGTTVKASLVNRDGRILAENETVVKDGRFLVCLPPQTAQTGCRLILAGGGEQFDAEDIAIGEVYLAGGQSNMELELRNADEGPEIIKDYNVVGVFAKTF